MKFSKSTALFYGLILATALAVFSIGACSHLQTQHQKIGAACETIASSVDAAVVAKQSGRISKEDLQKVVDVATPTARFCQPPAESLSAADYASLAGAALRIAAMPGVKTP